MVDIIGFEGIYKISDKGIIYNNKNKPIKPKGDGRGYFNVGLSKNGKRKFYKLHRLIACSFIPNVENKPFINHINGIKTDNRIENLEWCTNRENILHAIENGLLDYTKNRKLTDLQVKEIREDKTTSQRELANYYCVSQSTIRDVKRNKSYKKPRNHFFL